MFSDLRSSWEVSDGSWCEVIKGGDPSPTVPGSCHLISILFCQEGRLHSSAGSGSYWETAGLAEQ